MKLSRNKREERELLAANLEEVNTDEGVTEELTVIIERKFHAKY